MTFRIKCFESVCKAHKEYRAKTVRLDAGQIAAYLQNASAKATVKGMSKKWIVLRSMLKGANIFDSIAEKDFYKI